MKLQSDKETIRGCKQGFPDSQRLLYARYAPMIKALCARYIQNKSLISEVLQDSFIKIFKGIKNFKGEGSLEGWLKRIAVNTCLDHLRKQRIIKRETVGGFDDISIEMQEEISEEDEGIVRQMMEAGFSKDLLMEILHKLPENYSSVFNMFYIDEMGHRDIAESLQINEATSRKWAFRAKDMVKKHLKQYLDDKLKYSNGK